MHRPIAPLLSLIFSLSLIPSLLPSLPFTQAAQAATCPNPGSRISDLEQRIGQIRTELNQQNPREALRILQEVLPQVRSSSDAVLRATLLQQLLIIEPVGIQPSPLQSLQQALELDLSGADRGASNPKLFIDLIADLGPIAKSLPQGHSFTKVRSLVQLANYTIHLGQPQLATPLLQAAEPAAQTGVQGDFFRSRALAQVARGQAIANQPNAKKTLDQAVKLYASLPAKDQSQQLALDLGIAAASFGDEALAQPWSKLLPKETAAYISQTWVRSALRNRKHQAAVAIARRITSPIHQAESLGEISEFYARNASPVTGRAVLSQAWTTIKDDNIREQLVNAAGRSGYFDLAIDWSKQIQSSNPSALFQTLILTLAKAQQPENASQVLDRYLQQIPISVTSNWQSFEYFSWANTARRARLLGWVADRWTSLPQDVTAALTVESFATDYAQQTSIATASTWTEKLADRPENSPFPSKILAVTALADYAYAQQKPAQAQALLTQLEAQIKPYIQRLKKDGQSIGPIQSEAYARIARVYGKAGQMVQARRLIQLAIKANPDLGNPQAAQPSDNPYSLMMEAKLFGLAYEVAQSIASPETRLSWMDGAAIALAKTKQLEQAQQLLKQPNIVGFMRVNLLLTIAAQQQGNGAIETLNQALTAAKTIPGAESEFDHLGAEGGTVIPMETDRGSAVIAVAVAYAKAGRVDQAKAIVAQLKDAENRQDGTRLIQAAVAGGCN
jgi:hypothetical protein